MRELDDRFLVKQLKDGNKAAFQILFERYFSLFLTFSNNLMKDPADAEDVVQNVFIKIWVGRDKIDENKNFKNYLLVSVRNEIYQHFRFAAKNQHDNLSTDVIDNEINIETNLSARELEQRIRELVQKNATKKARDFQYEPNRKTLQSRNSTSLGFICPDGGKAH